ncbi:hypothetical protein PG985_006823 [Apiospora marii]|uniref:BZIP domain-containing protein n=1 Tax=Apiospora marii TaxID=335849 RepID=A0ABR1SFS7_9PEZI
MSVPAFEVEDPESGSQQRLERRRELNRKAQRRFRTRRNQARIRQIEQDNHLATSWTNEWPWSNSSSTLPSASQSHTREQPLFGTDDALVVDISALDSMLYPTIPLGVPLGDSEPLVPLQSPAMATLADSQPVASHSAAFLQKGEHHKATTQPVYPPWVTELSAMALAEPTEATVTDTGSPFMPDASVWTTDMSPSQSPENLAPCFYAPALTFDAATIPVAATGTTLPFDPMGELNWGDMESFQAALSWLPSPGT